MQAVDVVGILCIDSRSPAEIRVSIQEALSQGKLVSLNLKSSSHALQTLHRILCLDPVQNTLGKATASATASIAATCSHEQSFFLHPSAGTPAVLETSSSFINIRAQRRLLLEAELTSPPLSPRDPLMSLVAASDFPCAPATLAVSETAFKANSSSINSGSTDASHAAFNVSLAAQARPHTVHPSVHPDFTQGLIALNLSECRQVNAHSLKSASTLLSSMNLHTIIMENCGIDDDGAAALASTLSCYSSLRTLNLRHNAITDAGAKRLLVAARFHMKLQTIVCDGCRVSVRLQRTLWDLSKKKIACQVAVISPAAQRAQVPSSQSKFSCSSRLSNRWQHRHSAGLHRGIEAALSQGQSFSIGASHAHPHGISTFSTSIASWHDRSTERISTSASAPVSPVFWSSVGKQSGSVRKSAYFSSHARRASPLSLFESDNDSELINKFIQSRLCFGPSNHSSTGEPRACESHGVESTGKNGLAPCSVSIDDLLHDCATMQNRAGIPVPLHFNRHTPLHEIRAFMRREQRKRDKTSPARLLRGCGIPAEVLEALQLPAPRSPAGVPDVSNDSPLNSINAAKLKNVGTAATQHRKTKNLQYGKRRSPICGVGNSVTNDLSPRIEGALAQVPFSDLSVAGCESVVAVDDVHASTRAEVHSKAPTNFSRRLNFPPSLLSPSRSPLIQNSSSKEATAELVACSLLQQATTAELLSPQLPDAPSLLQHLVEATNGLSCIDDNSVLWAKAIDFKIRMTLQGAPSSPD
jgi:hypothetical protein